MPDEVFELWIKPLVESDGWPFTRLDRSGTGSLWRQYLGGHSLDKISKLRWQRQDVTGLFAALLPKEKQLISALATEYVTGIKRISGNVRNGLARFNRARQYIRAFRTLPKPIVVIHDGLFMSVMDGNHRLAALIAENLPLATRIPAWVGAL